MEYGIPPSPTNPLVILAAYDEEMAAVNHDWADETLTAYMYVRYQLERARYYYPFYMAISGIETWDSDDSLNTTETLFEAISELNWVPGAKRNGVKCDILVLFTGQDNDPKGGCASITWQACIVKKQHWVGDDNAAIHELGHLFNLHHCTEKCVMSTEGQYYYLYYEPLKPVRAGWWTIAYFRWEYHAYTCYDFCPPHWQRLLQIRDAIQSGESVFTTPEPGQDLFTDPEMKGSGLPKMKGPNPYVPLIIAIAVLVLIALAAAVIIRRRRRAKH